MAKKETNGRSIEETLWQACDKVANENKIERKEYKVEHLVTGVAPAAPFSSFATLSPATPLANTKIISPPTSDLLKNGILEISFPTAPQKASSNQSTSN